MKKSILQGVLLVSLITGRWVKADETSAVSNSLKSTTEDEHVSVNNFKGVVCKSLNLNDQFLFKIEFSADKKAKSSLVERIKSKDGIGVYEKVIYNKSDVECFQTLGIREPLDDKDGNMIGKFSAALSAATCRIDGDLYGVYTLPNLPTYNGNFTLYKMYHDETKKENVQENLAMNVVCQSF